MPQQGGVITYPVPAYQNLQIDSDFYQPSRFVISSISLGQTTTVSTSVAHNYVIGQEVRLIIPAAFGSFQLNEKKGVVISIPTSSQVVLDTDSSRNVDAFIASSETYPAVAQIVAIGDFNSGAINSNGRMTYITAIPGSFIDISPN